MGESGFMERKRSAALVFVALTLLVLFCVVNRGTAQEQPAAKSPARKTTSTSAHTTAKFKVPDNRSPHPAPAQPIANSHKQQVAFGLNSQRSHSNPEPGKLIPFPDTAKSMQCPVTIAKDKPCTQKIAQY